MRRPTKPAKKSKYLKKINEKKHRFDYNVRIALLILYHKVPFSNKMVLTFLLKKQWKMISKRQVIFIVLCSISEENVLCRTGKIQFLQKK